jgi:putative mRNA 3-end processing factor
LQWIKPSSSFVASQQLSLRRPSAASHGAIRCKINIPMKAPIISVQKEGLFCAAGNFYIDPWRGVERALITHGHADHARRGSEAYLCAAPGVNILKTRLGSDAVDGLAYGETRTIGDARVSFHPAGHVLGSAQIRIEVAGEIWVVSGDYKCAPQFVAEDTTCDGFEPVRCHTFITESTFGLPIYQWRAQSEIAAQINTWWAANAKAGLTSVLYAYGLGKAQRVLSVVDPAIGPLFVHSAIAPLNEIYRAAGVAIPAAQFLSDAPIKNMGALIIVPPSGVPQAGFPARWGEVSDATASGWMQLRGARRRQSVDRGFILSDHADWPGLLQAIRASEAQNVLVTHGQVAPLVRHLTEQGLSARALETDFGGEE